MPIALLGWELGGGLGHALPLLLIERSLRCAGFETVLAVRQRELFSTATPSTILQAPRHDAQLPFPGFVAGTFADILAVSGYADERSLLPLFDGWQAILDRVQPAVVLADHAPTLCLAARDQYPLLNTGTGFVLPPAANGVFPRMSEHERGTHSDDRVLESIQRVQQLRNRHPLESLGQLLESDARVVISLPELDPYAGLRIEPTAGPVEPLPPIAGASAKKFFAYLGVEMADCAGVLMTLARSGFPGRAFVRGADETLRQRLHMLGLDITDRPDSVERIIAESSVIIHHGGSAMAHAALAAGRPQLLFPAHLENLLTARKLSALGVAHVLSGRFPNTHVIEGLRQLMHDPAFTQRALARAQSVHARGPWNALEKIVAGCKRLALCRAS